MRVLIVSDTHGRHGNFEKVYDKIGPVDMVLHAGDVCGEEEWFRKKVAEELYMVRGNCDTSFDLPSKDVIAFGDKLIFLAHGHHYSVGYGPEEIADAAAANGCDIAVYGHTHVPLDMEVGGVRVLNPGSLERPRQGNGKPSFMILEMDDAGNMLCALNYLDAMGKIVHS